MRISSEPFGRFRRVRLINDAEDESVSIIPEFGANINELILSKGGKSHSIILGYRDYDELIEHRGAKSAKLVTPSGVTWRWQMRIASSSSGSFFLSAATFKTFSEILQSFS